MTVIGHGFELIYVVPLTTATSTKPIAIRLSKPRRLAPILRTHLTDDMIVPTHSLHEKMTSKS